MEAQPTPDLLCLRLAASQHGIITKDQALSSGLTPGQIKWRVGSGRWRGVWPRIFSIEGVPCTWHQQLLALCLWAGPLGAASHRSAAILWGLDGVRDRRLEISVPRKLSAPGVIIHRVGDVDLSRLRRRDGIPVTDPTDTLLNLAAVLSPFNMESALESALRLRLTHLDLLWERLFEVARSGRKGVRLTRRLLQARDPSMAPTASQLETMLSQLIERFGLPKPEQQYVIRDEVGNFVARVDFAYPAEKVAIEVQSYAYHHGRREWERDQDRLSSLTAMDWLVITITNLQMREHPELAADRIFRAFRLRSRG